MTFTLPDTSLAPESAGFGLGFLEIDVGRGAVADRDSKRLMMVVPSATLLLDGLRKFLSSPRQKKYEFVGVGSSMILLFTKVGKSVEVAMGGKRLATLRPAELAREVLRASVALELAVADIVPKSDAARQDLEASVAQFRDFAADEGF